MSTQGGALESDAAFRSVAIKPKQKLHDSDDTRLGVGHAPMFSKAKKAKILGWAPKLAPNVGCLEL